MRNALICNKWPIKLLEGTGGHFKWINKNPRAVGHNALCQEWLFSQAELKGLAVVEPFGGLGIASVIIQNMLQPRFHLVMEIDEDCMRQLRFAMEEFPEVHVYEGDAKNTMLEAEAELFVLDFASYTIRTYADWKTQWEAIMAQRPRAVTWFDSSANYLHLHRERYSTLFGQQVVNKEDYAYAMSQFMFKNHGYSITHAAYEPHAGMVYYLGQPVEPASIQMFTPDKAAIGFKFV